MTDGRKDPKTTGGSVIVPIGDPRDCDDVSTHRARYRAHVDPVEGGHDAGGAQDLAV